MPPRSRTPGSRAQPSPAPSATALALTGNGGGELGVAVVDAPRPPTRDPTYHHVLSPRSQSQPFSPRFQAQGPPPPSTLPPAPEGLVTIAPAAPVASRPPPIYTIKPPSVIYQRHHSMQQPQPALNPGYQPQPPILSPPQSPSPLNPGYNPQAATYQHQQRY